MTRDEPDAAPLSADVVAWRAFSDRFMDPAYRDDPDRFHIRDAFAAGWDAAIRASGSPTDAALRVLDVIDGIVDDTHPEGDGCPLCAALDELRAVLEVR